MNDEIVIDIPKKYHYFVNPILSNSKEASSIPNKGDRISIFAKQIIIDLDACAKAKGRPLTENEEDFLLTRHIRLPYAHVWRIGNTVYIEKSRGTSKCEVHLPLVMMDRIKKNALIRNKTISQMFVEMADYYLTTFGDASKEIKDYISKRHDDIQYVSGGKPEFGIMADKRTKKPRPHPDYPSSMTIDKNR